MTITLYNVSDEAEVLNKDLGTGTQYTGSVKDNGAVSMDEPTVLIAASGDPGANYCYIPAFDRYYYITRRRMVRSGLFEISCVSDPLMSFYASICSLSAVVQRTAADPENSPEGIGWNSLLSDHKIVTQVNRRVIEAVPTDSAGQMMQFTYDARPYLACIGCDAPDGNMIDNRVKGYYVYN